MTDQSAQEPTMEEILASIRRIISEDDAPAEASAPEAPAPVEAAPEPEPFAEPEAEPVAEAPAPAFEPEPVEAEPAEEEEVLDLTERYETPVAQESIGDLDLSGPEPFPEPAAPAPEPEPEPAPAPVAAPVAATPAEPLVSAVAAGAAASAFAGLSAAARTPGDGRSLEDIVRELLRPMLKDWLDANLPGIVEREVRAEVERISRQGSR